MGILSSIAQNVHEMLGRMAGENGSTDTSHLELFLTSRGLGGCRPVPREIHSAHPFPALKHALRHGRELQPVPVKCYLLQMNPVFIFSCPQ